MCTVKGVGHLRGYVRTYVRLRVRATHARTRDTTRLRVGITFGLSRVQDGCEEFTAILGELSPGRPPITMVRASMPCVFLCESSMHAVHHGAGEGTAVSPINAHVAVPAHQRFLCRAHGQQRDRGEGKKMLRTYRRIQSMKAFYRTCCSKG